MQKKRDTGVDLLRIILCFLVIMIHCRNSSYYDEHKLLDSIVRPIWFLSNSCFFMVSGYYALSSKEVFKEGGVLKYYKKKAITVLLPLILYSALYIIDEQIAAGGPVHLKAVLSDYLIRLLSNKVSFHLWFVYVLISNFLAVPILSFAFKDMPRKTKIIVFLTGTVVMQTQIILSDFDVSFGIGFILTGWLYVFCIGWFIEKEISQKNEKWLYLGGLIGYILTILGIYFLPVYKNATDWALPHIIFSVAVFILFKRHIIIKGKVAEKIVTFVSRYTFYIYLIHVWVIRRLPSSFMPITIKNEVIRHLLGSFKYFMVSLVLVILIDYLFVRPAKSLTRQIFRSKRESLN